MPVKNHLSPNLNTRFLMLKIKQALCKPAVQIVHAMYSPHLKGFDTKCK